MNNVAGKADYEAVQKELSTRLMDTLRTTGDPRVTKRIEEESEGARTVLHKPFHVKDLYQLVEEHFAKIAPAS